MATFDINGKTFSRKIISDGLFGQPKGERIHIISFTAGLMNDNSSTFFGNPPNIGIDYELKDTNENGVYVVFYDNARTGNLTKSAYTIDTIKGIVFYNGVQMTEQ